MSNIKNASLLVSVFVLGGCSLPPCTIGEYCSKNYGTALAQTEKEVSQSVSVPTYKYDNVYKIDTPYGLDSLSKETVAPEVYSIVATRTVNRMLDDTKDFYEKPQPNRLYITETKLEEDLPNGFYLSQAVTKNVIEASRTFDVVNNLKDADYYTETLIKKIQIDESSSPIIQYKMMLFDMENNKINEWSETIRQLENDDRSWW
ncbi:MAG: hypothetical protein PHE89_04925 [Alphaproteobacteria bacterium]|nr:hypothetical protein [Alphaproteobacteria bacterium]